MSREILLVLLGLEFFTVTVLGSAGPPKENGAACAGFRKESDDVMSQCAIVRHIWSNRRSHVTLRECEEESCSHGGNVFNYLPANESVTGRAECQPRFCDRLGLMPIPLLGGWDVWRRHMFGSCRKESFRREFTQSEGFYSDCAHLAMPTVTSFEQCMKKTCELNGTVFNFRTTQTRKDCAIKLCDFNGIHVVRDKGGWDVYHAQLMRKRCDKRFLKIYDSSTGVASSCILRGWAHVSSAAECAHLACERRANVYNYRQRACYVESCRSPLLKPMHREGWQLYVKDD